MIIFNERKRIADIINRRDKKAILNKYTLIRSLIKYYYPQFANRNWKEYYRFILSEMDKFQFDIEEYEEWEYSDFVKRTCKNALNGEFNVNLRNLDYVEITEAEFDIIAKAETNPQKKLLFTLYVLAKLYPYDSGWVNFRDAEIFKLANVHLSIEDRDYLIHDLKEQGLLELNHIVGKSGLRVKLASDSPVALRIERPDHFGNQYLLYLKNHEWMMCERCGRLIRRNNNKQKYCKYCYKKLNHERALERYKIISA